MTLLVRKIDLAKWMQNDAPHGGEISADAVTNCLRTVGNTLSTWSVASYSKVMDAVLAHVSGYDCLDTTDFVCIDTTFFHSNGIDILSAPGNTPVKDLIDTHVNISRLTFNSLGTIANMITNEIRDDKILRCTRGKMRNLIKDAIQHGRININDLKDGLRKHFPSN
jgi:hypothetical protein